jgi:serine phosphatase RsbU (regulator of sigma subunit)
VTLTAIASHPFPGLRPYEASESDMFFGRDEQIDELLARLRESRFVAVVGSSGSGKSSLVSAGLIPALKRGYLVGTGSQWRVASMRPGGNPIGELARNAAASLETSEDKAVTELARSSLGLAKLAERCLHPSENLLVVVDQFEELFRYHREAAGREQREASAAFVKLLLTATGRSEVPVPGLDHLPVFVVITMRSDYLGKSSQFRGLPEALNNSQYLVPRMLREQIREAIEGPVGMAGARIAPQLVQRLLNDMGDNPDQLPVLQHVLMRCWEVSRPARDGRKPIDLPHYEDAEVGGISRALNLDAEHALASLGDDARKEEIVRRVFQRLVEPGAEDEESRRPSRLSDLVAVCASSESDVLAAIQPFRERGFLVFSGETDPIVDISHESLIRLWDKLKIWVKREVDSAATYTQLADWVKAGFAAYSGLALDQALHWRETENPNDAWAKRYRPGADTFRQAIEFLLWSRKAREDAERRDLGFREIDQLQRFEQEINIARDIQQALLPRNFRDFPHLSVSAVNFPCLSVGGDYFDVFPLDDKRAAFLLAGVSGKGLGAAMLATMLQGALSGMTLGTDPARVITHLNRYLCDHVEVGRYATMFFGILGDSGRMEYINAGHPSPILLRQGTAEEAFTEGSFPVGLVPEAEYSMITLHLQPNDTLVLFSDGVTEAMNGEEELYGVARLRAALLGKNDLPLEDLQKTVLESVENFVREARQADDLTLLLVRYRGAAAGSARVVGKQEVIRSDADPNR